MFKQKAAAITIAGVVLCGICPQISQAETFKSSEFLKWKPATQEFYIRTSLNMAGVIAAQADRTRARCIDNWHARHGEQSYTDILEAMRRYPAYHPQGVMLALINKACP